MFILLGMEAIVLIMMKSKSKVTIAKILDMEAEGVEENGKAKNNSELDVIKALEEKYHNK